MSETRTVPAITIQSWPEMAIPVSEIEACLTYLAYKSGRPVVFCRYAKDQGYSDKIIRIQVASGDGSYPQRKIGQVSLAGNTHELSNRQVAVAIKLAVPEEKIITDDESNTLAFVDYNRIVIPIDFTATDNAAARALLAYIIEQSIPLLDFSLAGPLLERQKQLVQHYREIFAQAVEIRIKSQEKELEEGRREADQAYRTIVEFERKRPVLEKQLRFLKKLAQIRMPRLLRQEAKALIDLVTSGQFTDIQADDDAISATTRPITIEHDNWRFPMGRYTIEIHWTGDVRIEALDEHPDADYPHPHVTSDGHPCLGSVAADVPAMIGSMRIAEALQVLYQFLCSYNSHNPYERIGHFDPTGQYCDPDEDRCQDCDQSCSPYCIFECQDNNGQYYCEDCYDYRTDYCYLGCNYNENFERHSPCDNCQNQGTEHCYLNCQYNDNWQLHRPCQEHCRFDQCNDQCPYYVKFQRLKEVLQNADKD